MAEISGPVSSAVALTESEIPKSPTTKRRRSSSADSTSKRLKLEQDITAASPNTLQESPQSIEPPKDVPVKSESVKAEVPRQESRKSSIQEEKKRGQRLFGGLLSTLSQSTPNGQQKRRLEIEKRQQEKAKQQKAADEVRRAERLANLKTIRKAEQIKFNEESMRIRHSNMLAMAHFLSTKAEPKIYYKPWELRPEDGERIKIQIAETEDIIERELAAYEGREPKERKPIEAETTNNTSKETLGEPQTESPSAANIDTTNDVQEPESVPDIKNHVQEEHHGEVVVENEEDTVIY